MENNLKEVKTIGEFVDLANDAEKVYNETGKTPRQLYDENKMLLEALKYCNDGLDYFFSKLNFGASFLDAKAITYMNKFPLKIKEAINKTTL